MKKINEKARFKGSQLFAGVSELLASALIVGALWYIHYLFKDEMAVFTFYLGMYTGTMILMMPLVIFLAVHGCRFLLIQSKWARARGAIVKIPPNAHFVIAGLLTTAAMLGLFTAIIPNVRNLAIVRDDLGYGTTTTINVFLTGSCAILILLAAEHVAIGSGRRIILPYKKIIKRMGGVKRTGIIQKKQLTVVSHYTMVLFLALLISGGSGYFISEVLSPGTCFNGIHGFSTPSYDLIAITGSAHHTSDLDNTSLVNQDLLQGLEKALWAMTRLQSRGGFPMISLDDGSEMYSDRGASCPLFIGEFSLQGGTPRIAQVYLDMYSLEPNPVYLNVALAAADALIAVQDDLNGGFYYDGRVRDDGTGFNPHPRNSRRAAIFDDNVMQSCLDFLLDVYDVTGNTTYRDAAVRGLNYIFELEKPGGGWPQRSNYQENVYPSYTTLNDNSMRDIMFLLLKAYDRLGDVKYLQAVERGARFLIRVQGNGRGANALQMAWAQQYDNDQPAWARAFEPPAFCSLQTGSAIQMLMETYLYTENETYLEPIPAAINWLTDSNTTVEDIWENPGSFVWSRLYEPVTNRLIVGNRNNQETGPIYYYDYVPERDTGYAWIRDFGLNTTISNFLRLNDTYNRNISEYRAWRNTPSYSSESTVTEIYNAMSDDGFWTESNTDYKMDIIKDSTFSSNALKMISYFKGIFAS
ncbi:MAG: pectate lyase [Promethearchaeota archaeon]